MNSSSVVMFLVSKISCFSYLTIYSITLKTLKYQNLYVNLTNVTFLVEYEHFRINFS